VTFHLVCLGWLFFRAPDFGTAFKVLSGILSFRPFTSADIGDIGYIALGLTGAGLAIAGSMHLATAAARRLNIQHGAVWAAARPFVLFIVFAAMVMMGSQGAQQFIYFQF
jgi:hypothetical protein